MGASRRRIVLDLKDLTMCQCQIHGNQPIMWHKENCESSCAGTISKSRETSGCELVICAGDAQPWIKMQSSFSSDAKQTESSSRNAWRISPSGLTREEAKAIGENAGWPQVFCT